MRLLIWGAGELGTLVARQWAHGPTIGYTKTTARHRQLRELGLEPRTGNAASALRPEDALLISLPGTGAKAEVLAALAKVPPPRRAILISTTGYYGSPQGRVDEDTPPGRTEGAQAVARVEQIFRAWAGEAGVIIRPGGLYRPGRGPMAALARRGTVSAKPPNKTLALIHYEDAATAVAAALQQGEMAPVYLAVTPPCPSRREVFEAAAARLGLEAPPFADPLPGPAARYDATRLRRDLLPRPAYPDWRAALTLP